MTNINMTSLLGKFCRDFSPCHSHQSLDEYLNLTASLVYGELLTANGGTFVQIQRTCDAALIAANFPSINMAAHLVLALLSIIAAPISLFTNIGVILTINNDKELNYTRGLLVKNMAVSDLLFGVVGGLLIAYVQLELVVSLYVGSSSNFLARVVFNIPLVYAQGYLLRIAVVTNMIFMTISVFDLHKKISGPFRYVIFKQEKLPLMQKVCAFTWCIVAVCYTYPMFGHWAYYTLFPFGPFVSTIGRCTAIDGSDGIWLLRSIYIIGLCFILTTIVYITLYAKCCVKEWKGMSSVTRRRQIARSKLTAISFSLYTFPCLMYICAAMEQGEVVTPAVETFLIVFCLVRCCCAFSMNYYLQISFRKSARSLAKETIPRKVRQLRLQVGIGSL